MRHHLPDGEKEECEIAGLANQSLGDLVELLDHPVTLQARQVIDIEHAIEVIEFVLANAKK